MAQVIRRGLAVLADDPAHGPLPALLLALTAVTGLVDAVSILGLGRVFVANMTGNVVFIGFALAQAPGFSLPASLAALLGFLAGAFAGGGLVSRFAGHRGLLVRNCCGVQLALVAVAFAAVTAASDDPGTGTQVGAAALLASAMGIQNSMARKLAVPDLTTTVLTMTLTGIAADSRSSPSRTTVRRALAVLTMFLGAVVGTMLTLHRGLSYPLALASVLLAVVVAVAALRSGRGRPGRVLRPNRMGLWGPNGRALPIRLGPTRGRGAVAVDEELMTQLRAHLGCLESVEDWDTIEERRIVGGTGFFWHGHLLCGAMGDDLLVRIAKTDYEDVVGEDDARPMQMGGRSSRSWLLVPKSAAAQPAVMATWVERSVRYVGSLPTR